MELSDLLTFSTVARLGGITRAADELNTVQSNVTQRVKALEAEIGTALFERHSRGMTLTGAGRRLLDRREVADVVRLGVVRRDDVHEAEDTAVVGQTRNGREDRTLAADRDRVSHAIKGRRPQ